MKRCFQIHPSDNVATLLEDASPGPVEVIGGVGRARIILTEPVRLGHKVSLCEIAPDAPVLKFGVPIGLATRTIRAGEWVHLHNCRSQVDGRSSTLDLETGAATDVPYE